MKSKPLFSASEYARYRRHLNLSEFGVEGQQRLREGSVLLIGLGGLGCPVALYLAASGVGRLGLVDDDIVDLSNLQRQILYSTGDLGKSKLEVAEQRIVGLNPDILVESYDVRMTSNNALDLIQKYDVIVDGSDNFSTRYLINDACVLLGKACVYGAILRFEGQASVFDATRGPCYRCLFPEPPPPDQVVSCAEGGVLGVLPGMISMVQSTEAIKLLAGIGEPLIGRFVQYDALDLRFSEYRFVKDPNCPICSDNSTISELIDYNMFCGVESLEESSQIREVAASYLEQIRFERKDHLLIDVRGEAEFSQAAISGSMLVPLDELKSRLDELVSWINRPVIVHCHHGGRGESACRILLDAGFRDVSNLTGGIDAWSLSVDPDVARY